MEKLSFGEIAILENNKQYVVFFNTNFEGNDYVYLMSNFKPIEVVFAKQIQVDGELRLEPVTDQRVKEALLEEFKKLSNV